MSKTILVIGARSGLARDAIRLLSADNTVITAGRSGCDVVCDITAPITIPDGVEIIVNFAAAFGGDEDEAILSAVQTNEIGILHICMAAQAAGVAHIVNISSMSATHDKSSPYYSAYAITKRHGDELAQYYCQANKLALTTLRPSQLYGEDEAIAKHQPFFYRILDAAASGEDITIYGKHDALRNYLHVHDLSEIIYHVIDQKLTGTYPCLNPENVSYATLAKTAQQVFGRGGSIVFLKDRPDTPDNVFTIDLSIYEKTGYRPQVTLEAGIHAIQEKRKGATT